MYGWGLIGVLAILAGVLVWVAFDKTGDTATLEERAKHTEVERDRVKRTMASSEAPLRGAALRAALLRLRRRLLRRKERLLDPRPPDSK